MDCKTASNRQLQLTADGSPTLYLPDLDEHYHSVKGALTESMHIFIGCGLHHVERSRIRVFEVGFGTGLNAALTALHCGLVAVDYYSIERYPISAEEAEAIVGGLDADVSAMLRCVHSCAWDKPCQLTPQFSLSKINGDLITVQLPRDIDVVYFDAFAPEKQPEMWSPEIFANFYDAMAQGGVLVTYCAKGIVRRTLQAVGFTVERLPGPPGGKREILRATKK